jgi:hypothetical protein
VRLQLPGLLKQHKPDPFGVVPTGQLPVKVGVVHVPPALERLQVKCSALTSCHKLPPVTVAEAEATKILKETLALVPQLVPTKHELKATPVAEAQETLVPIAPVRWAVF